MKYFIGLIALIFATQTGAMDTKNGNKQLFSPELYQTIFANDFIRGENSTKNDGTFEWNDETAYHALDSFLERNGIKDYVDAGNYGLTCRSLVNSDELSAQLYDRFKTNTKDILPEKGKKYQVAVFNTTGIDAFILRLAFFARLVKSGQCSFDSLTAIVGTHRHRDHIRTPKYLAHLPGLFSESFDLPKQTEEEILAPIADLVKKDEWIHRDGMEAALGLVAQDPVMKEASSQFGYFVRETGTPKELFRELLTTRLKHKLSPENPVAIITTSQGIPALTEVIKQACPEALDSIDILAPAEPNEELEQKLFNNTREQGIIIRLLAMRNALKNARKTE